VKLSPFKFVNLPTLYRIACVLFLSANIQNLIHYVAMNHFEKKGMIVQSWKYRLTLVRISVGDHYSMFRVLKRLRNWFGNAGKNSVSLGFWLQTITALLVRRGILFSFSKHSLIVLENMFFPFIGFSTGFTSNEIIKGFLYWLTKVWMLTRRNFINQIPYEKFHPKHTKHKFEKKKQQNNKQFYSKYKKHKFDYIVIKWEESWNN